MSWDDRGRLTDDLAHERLVSEMRIDRRASTPLYRQVSDCLREMILKGVLAAGTPLPTEPRLARNIHVSRYTLRQAIDELARQGFIRRVHGRGNFIVSPPRAQPPGYWTRPNVEPDSLAQPQHVRVLRVDYVARVPQLSSHFADVFLGTVAEIVRVRLSADTALSVERIYIPGDAAASVDTEMLSQQWLTRLLERWHGVTPTHSREQLRLTQADDDTRTLLGLAPDSAIFLRETLIFSDERILALRRSFLPANAWLGGFRGPQEPSEN